MNEKQTSRPPRVAGPLDRTLIERLDHWKAMGLTDLPGWGYVLHGILVELAEGQEIRPRATIDPVVLEQNLVVQNILKRLESLETPLGDNVNRVLLNKIKSLEALIQIQRQQIDELANHAPATKRAAKARKR